MKGEKENIENYRPRPISLLLNPYKIFEKILTLMLTKTMGGRADR